MKNNIVKRAIICIMLLALITIMCGCNMSLGLGNFEYKKVHIDTHNYSGCFTIEKWYDSGTGIEVKTEEVGSLFLSEGTYCLIADECPFCKHQTKKGGDE